MTTTDSLGLQQQYVLPASNVVESNFIESSRDQIAAEEVEISDNNATPSSPMVVEEGVSQSHHASCSPSSLNVSDASPGNIVDDAHELQKDFNDYDASVDKPLDKSGEKSVHFLPKDIHERNMRRQLQTQLSTISPSVSLDPSVSSRNAMLEAIRSRNRSNKTTSPLVKVGVSAAKEGNKQDDTLLSGPIKPFQELSNPCEETPNPQISSAKQPTRENDLVSPAETRVCDKKDIPFQPNRMKLWHARFDELNDYKKMYGDCLVPSSYPPNPPLGTWVCTQRTQYRLHTECKRSSMTSKRIAALDSNGQLETRRTHWNMLSLGSQKTTGQKLKIYTKRHFFGMGNLN
jgi:hypothetical protein